VAEYKAKFGIKPFAAPALRAPFNEPYPTNPTP